MKIVFEDSELNEGIIKISLDGGFTFTDYEITDVKESGILLDDSQDYEKIKIKGPANILKNLNVFSSVKVEDALNYQNKSPTHIYAWTYYPYETIHTFTRNPQVGDFAFAFNNVEHGFKVDPITGVKTDEDGNVNTIIVRGGTFNFQCEHTIDVGEFSSAHVTQSSFLYNQSEE